MERGLRALLVLLALAQLVTGALLWFAPGFFFTHVGPYGMRNDHYMGDLATYSIALGVLALVALRRPSWRVPVLALAVLQYALHAANHLVDIGNAHPSWLGPANFMALLAATAVLAWALTLAARA